MQREIGPKMFEHACKLGLRENVSRERLQVWPRARLDQRSNSGTGTRLVKPPGEPWVLLAGYGAELLRLSERRHQKQAFDCQGWRELQVRLGPVVAEDTAAICLPVW